MSSYSVGAMLKNNIMDGRPSRMKSYSDYTGLIIPPCGDFTPQSSLASVATRPPWMSVGHAYRSSRRLSLHEEIICFMEYMAPTREEKALREDLVVRFTQLIGKLAPGVTVGPVGSYITKLYFPTSDIDMVISFNHTRFSDTKTQLRVLEYELRRSGFASRIDSVLQASTPLLRITDAKTGLEIDLTADDGHGRRATETVSSWLGRDESGSIKALVVVVKMFLSIRRLGTTFTGGINSYVLVWMVVAYLKLETPKQAFPRSTTVDDIISRMSSLHMSGSTSTNARTALTSTSTARKPAVDLGDALLGFLRFYGQDFDYINKSIRFSGIDVHISLKPFVPGFSTDRYGVAVTQRYFLHITDPADSTIDMGCKAYGIKHARETFRDAYDTLSALVDGTGTRGATTRAAENGLFGSFMGGDFSSFIAERKRIGMTWKGRS